MDSELKRLLEENVALAQDTNRILHRMQRAARWGRMFRVFYWTLLIGSMLGIYYYFRPFFETIMEQYRAAAAFFPPF